MSGDGIAQSYTWHEEAFELEVSVNVTKDTRAKDIRFKATPNSIDLRLVVDSPQTKDDNNDDVILLDPTRPLKGKVSLEGTFWELSDPTPGQDHRQVTVTIEKQIRTAKDDFDVIDYDWKGLYAKEEDDEVIYRRYDEAEELDVREYAASLGVDIDNINMSMVDKSMFNSGLNLTKSSFESLQEAGLMKEVTRQNDGSEWVTNDDGDRIPFNSMGGKIPPETEKPPPIPFLDTDSPWHKTVPVVEKKEDGLEVELPDDVSTDKLEDDKKRQEKLKELKKKRQEQASDPIETLTVARLKEILKARGLKVSGNKKELQDRLRAEVTSLLNQPNDNGEGESSSQ